MRLILLFISVVLTFASISGQTQAYYSIVNLNVQSTQIYPPEINNEPMPSITALSMSAVGNSITECCTGCSFTYVKVLDDSTLLNTIYNKGVSGNTMAKIVGIRDGFRSQITQSYTRDIISIFGGTNDWAFNVPLGDVSDHSDTNNLAGAVNYFIDLIQANSPGSIIILVTPLARSRDKFGVQQSYEPTNDLGYTTKDYRDKIIEVGVNRGVRILDLYEINGLKFSDILTWGFDGLHLNNTGQMRLGRIYKSFLLNQDYKNLY